MIKCEVHRTPGDDYLRAYFPFDPDLIESLKANMPKYARLWDPEQHCWLVLVTQLNILDRTLKEHGYAPEYLDHRRSQGSQPKAFTDPIEALFMETPQELRRKLYRQLTLALHPDNGGSEDMMKRLNIVWDKMGRGEQW